MSSKETDQRDRSTSQLRRGSTVEVPHVGHREMQSVKRRSCAPATICGLRDVFFLYVKIFDLFS